MSAFRPPAPWSRPSQDPNDVLVAHKVRPPGAKARVGLFGIPFDGAVLGRRGAAQGPAAIREALAGLKPWTFGAGAFDPDVVDHGDVPVPADDVPAAHRAVGAAAAAVLGEGQFPLALGGDHSLTFPLAAAHGSRIGVVNLDAHLDLRETHGGRITSGTPFARLVDAGVVSPEHLVEVGARDFATSPHYGEKADRLGVAVVTAADARAEGVADVVADAVKRASRGTKGVYLSVDMDVLDQAHGPGVSAPTPDGWSSAELLAAVRAAARSGKLVGADIVEVAPPYDEGGRTARTAAWVALSIVQGVSASPTAT